MINISVENEILEENQVDENSFIQENELKKEKRAKNEIKKKRFKNIKWNEQYIHSQTVEQKSFTYKSYQSLYVYGKRQEANMKIAQANNNELAGICEMGKKIKTATINGMQWLCKKELFERYKMIQKHYKKRKQPYNTTHIQHTHSRMEKKIHFTTYVHHRTYN